MRKAILISIILLAILWLSSCWKSNAPLTEAQQAEKYNMTTTEYKEMKNAAAQMNMTIEDHMKMMWGNEGEMNHEWMDMWDDSSMIEDDNDWMHKMDDWTMMSDDKMHMEMMHKDDEIENHDADEHWKHE